MKKLLLFLLSIIAVTTLHAQEQTADVHTSDAAMVKAPAASEKPLLVEDGKLWTVKKTTPHSLSPYRFIEYKQWFEGTKVINGKTYNILKAQIAFPTLSDIYEVAYMREEHRRVYSLATASELPIGFLGSLYTNNYLHTNQEAMVYDFNLDPGDSYYWFDPEKNDQILNDIEKEWGTSPVSSLRNPITVEKVDTLYMFKYPLRYQLVQCHPINGHYMNHQFYDRVGSLQAYLPFPSVGFPYDTPSTWDIEVFDPDGSLIFSTKELNGVESTSISVEGALGYEVTDSEIIVNGITGKATVVLLTPAGKIVKTVHIRDGETVDLSDLTRGVYILHIIDDASRISDKVAL